MDEVFNTQGTIQDVPLESKVEDAGEHKAATSGKHVLLVEDDDFLRGLLSKNMDEAGFKVDAAADAEIGFTFLKKQRPDIILLDLILPGMNGFDFLNEAKQKYAVNCPVLVLSNLGSQEDVVLAKNLGATDFLIKANVTPGQIIARVNAILST